MNDKLQLNDSTAVKGIPKDDEDLTRSFILKSPSEETRRTYRNTLKEFVRYCELRQGKEIKFFDITFEDVIDWRDFLIKAGKRPHTVSTKLAIIRSLFEYGRAFGIFERNPASAKLVPPPKKPKHSPGRALTPKEVMSLLSWFKLETLLGARDGFIASNLIGNEQTYKYFNAGVRIFDKWAAGYHKFIEAWSRRYKNHDTSNEPSCPQNRKLQPAYSKYESMNFILGCYFRKEDYPFLYGEFKNFLKNLPVEDTSESYLLNDL